MVFFTKKEAAEYLGVSYATFLKFVKSGIIAADYKRLNKDIFSKGLLDKFKLCPVVKQEPPSPVQKESTE